MFTLIIIMAMVMISGGVYLAKNKKDTCESCGSRDWDTSGHNAGLCWSCSDLLDEEMDALHYHCRECRNMNDPCDDCWELIDKGQHPQQPIKSGVNRKVNIGNFENVDIYDKREIIQKMIDHNTSAFGKIAHSDHKGTPQEKYLEAQRKVLFEELWKIKDSFNNA